jgi:hypothetical protein
VLPTGSIPSVLFFTMRLTWVCNSSSPLKSILRMPSDNLVLRAALRLMPREQASRVSAILQFAASRHSLGEEFLQ